MCLHEERQRGSTSNRRLSQDSRSQIPLHRLPGTIHRHVDLECSWLAISWNWQGVGCFCKTKMILFGKWYFFISWTMNTEHILYIRAFFFFFFSFPEHTSILESVFTSGQVYEPESLGLWFHEQVFLDNPMPYAVGPLCKYVAILKASLR